jgi:1,6-anhydro-N-acetylmuramate kinase
MVPKPAHSGCESWLQSVWAVGRHLSQYSSAVDAFAAHGTCKQLTPQITVICGGARENTMLYLNTHATCANAPER